jgi:hypothetical protein
MDNRLEPAPAIPRIDTGGDGPLALIDAQPGRFRDIMASGRDHYGGPALRLGDRLSKAWLEKSANPYRDEIAAVAARLDGPGAWLLNLSYEWTCTTGIAPDTASGGMKMLRTLDWPLKGLGLGVVVAGHEGGAGAWWNVTWPGFVGVATAMAPGRFAAAINQPPMTRRTPSCWLDWVINRAAVWQSRALPPVHLLRRVFETARTYAEAKEMLARTPLSIPVFFSLAGTGPGEGCVIERLENGAVVRDAPAAAANHWIADHQSGQGGGRMRGEDSLGRYARMESLLDRMPDDFSWVRSPILNPTTRLAVIANPGAGALSVRGYEEDGPATAVFRL